MTQTIVSSATREVIIGFDRPFVMIGERINPTGRQLLADGGRGRQQMEDGPEKGCISECVRLHPSSLRHCLSVEGPGDRRGTSGDSRSRAVQRALAPLRSARSRSGSAGGTRRC